MEIEINVLKRIVDSFSIDLQELHHRLGDLEDKERDRERAGRRYRQSSRRRSPTPRRNRRRSRSQTPRRSPRRKRHKLSETSWQQSVHLNNLHTLDCESDYETKKRVSGLLGGFGKILDIYIGPNRHWGKVTFDTVDECQNCLSSYINCTDSMICEPQNPPPASHLQDHRD